VDHHPCHRVKLLKTGEDQRLLPFESSSKPRRSWSSPSVVAIVAFRVKHWGARTPRDTYRGYNGYVLERNNRRILFGGDTALSDSFAELRDSGPIDLAIMPIGAYNPWIHSHCAGTRRGPPFLVSRERLAIGRVDRMERHGSTPGNCFLPLRRAGGRAVRYNPEHFSSEVENAICLKTMPWFPSPTTPTSGAAPASLMPAPEQNAMFPVL
jgi:L-ascorbate metabolism protein UlaG (beta-lactamase superfamily)